MARFVYECRTNVYWLTTIATTSTPRVNELTAGVNLTNFVAKDGVEVNINSNNVDSATIAEIFDAQVVGSYGADLQLTMFRDDGATDTAWATCVYGTNGYLVIDRFSASGSSPTNGKKVEVWPAEMHVPSPENSAANTDVRFIEKFAVTSAPYLSATVTTATT
jgi:hypothetical protein